MSLEFEKLTTAVAKMAATAAQRQQLRSDRLTELVDFLHAQANRWEALESRLAEALSLTHAADPPINLRAARPFDPTKPFDQAINPPPAPPEAVLVATDGSQIVPDRHASFVYYLVNVGGMIYYHGQERAPEVFSEPELRFPPVDDLNVNFADETLVSLERDRLEMDTLAQLACSYVGNNPNQPLLAIMDQRLLYRPFGVEQSRLKREVTLAWQQALDEMRRCGVWTLGYIDRPTKSSVIRLLHIQRPEYDVQNPNHLGNWEGLNDTNLFGQILEPGQRSVVFVDVSLANQEYATRQQLNEMCFFYLKVGRGARDIARIDIPRWVAQNGTAVAAIHALIVEQCSYLGSYPYIIARADEMAVVGRQDVAELEFRIGRMMDQHGLTQAATAKQRSKDIVRSGKQRHSV